jgi:RNA polymerase sigma factor (sigma-70 family)
LPLPRDLLANPEPLIRRVYAYVAYRIGDGPEAEDVTSDTFERALRYRDTFDPARGEPVGWLIGIARRCIDDSFRQRMDMPSEPPETAAPGDLAHDAHVRVDVARAVNLLSEQDRELIALRYGADLTARQIAEELGSKTNAVEVALHRALNRLRAALEGDPQSGEPAPARPPLEPGSARGPL